jgi:ubiquinol-cytochrome c reductase cytochrome b subunit
LFKQLADWLDDRSGFRHLMKEALDEPIPGGARWRYVFGSALSVVFLVQVFTGLLLMTSYSPSSSTAWGSVFYISHEMWAGWFIRGVHHFAAQAMVALLVLHLLQVLLAGAYRRPRELNWWFGMALLFLTLGFSLTGYLLPWDQKGYWATKVATNIMGGAPGIGPYIQKVIVGGPDYGNQTVTRFYGLHVGFLPVLLVLCLVAHVALFRRHGITTPPGSENRPVATFWPEQLFMDTVASALVVGVVIVLVMAEGGANLDAPADPASSDYPARPEWYFLSLFQMLKLFPGSKEIIGTFVIPSALVVVMLLLPILDRLLPRKSAHFLACGFVFAVVGAGAYLTLQAMLDDRRDELFQQGRRQADIARHRALYLAGLPDVGIPPDGAAYILRRDPLTQGHSLLERRCFGCHVFEGKGTGTQTASDLHEFGSRAWVRGLLENPASASYFGTAKKLKLDGMAEWKRSSKLTAKELDDVAGFVASFASVPDGMTTDDWLNSPGVAEHKGLKPFQKECGTCHIVAEGLGEGGVRDAPRLFGWGSPWWIARMIRNPRSSEKYGFLDEKLPGQMPAFDENQITSSDLQALVRYLKGDYAKPEVTTAAH